MKGRSLRGSVLILTLWVLTLLVFFTVGVGRCVSAQLRFAAHLQDRLALRYLAQAGVEKALVVLAADQTSELDALNESWGNNQNLFKEIPLGDGYVTVGYRLSRESPLEETTNGEAEPAIVYGLMDESSKININTASVQMLAGIFENVAEIEPDEAADIANSIADWRDVDGIISSGGAEDDYYQELDLAYPCKNNSFQVPEELLLVKGISDEIYAKISDLITVYGEGGVNLNSVNQRTLQALGLNRELSQRIISYRRGPDEIEGTEDDNIFRTPTEIINIGPLFTTDAEEVGRLISQNILKVNSDVFKIYSTGILKKATRQAQTEIVCIVQRDKQTGARILYWHEN